MIIEPNRKLRDSLGHVLSTRGYAVDYARDEKTALESLMRGELPNVILLELELSGRSGWSFLAHQKSIKQLKRIPTLVYSGQTPESEAELLESLERICEDDSSALESEETRSPLLRLPARLKI